MDRLYRRTPTTFYRLTFVLVLMGAIGACNVEELQPGVVVADIPHASLSAGTVVSVGALNERENFYRIMTDNESGSYNVPAGTVRLFDTRAAAEQFVRDWEGILGETAFAAAHALRIRSGPRTSDDVVYRLRMDEEVSLVSALESPTTINGRTGVWVEVVAGGSYRGYVFGPLLRGVPEAISTRTGTAAGTDQLSNEMISVTDIREIVGSTPWWSETAASGFRLGEPILEAFRMTNDNIDVVIDEKSWSIPLHGGQLSYPQISYSEEGLVLTIRDADRIELHISTEKIEYRRVFVPTDRYSWNDLRTIYQRRRDFAVLLDEYVGTYRSASYGEITLHGDGTLSWSGGNILAPIGIPAGGRQNMIMNVAPVTEPAIRDTYRGGINLNPPDGPSFLVELQPDAMRLIWLPEFDPVSPRITTVPVSPVVMYFSRNSP